MRQVVPFVSRRFFHFLRGGIANAPGGEAPVSEHLNRQRGIDRSRRAVGIWDWESIVGVDRASLLRREAHGS